MTELTLVRGGRSENALVGALQDLDAVEELLRHTVEATRGTRYQGSVGPTVHHLLDAVHMTRKELLGFAWSGGLVQLQDPGKARG